MSTTDDSEDRNGSDAADTDAFVADPEAAEQATRQRMAEQAEQERQVGHPVSSDPNEELEAPGGSAAAGTGADTTGGLDDAAGRHSAVPGDTSFGSSGATAADTGSESDTSESDTYVSDTYVSDTNMSDTDPARGPAEYPEGTPDTAPAGVPSPRPETRPVPDVEPVPGVSPDPSDVPGDPSVPGSDRPPLD
jgi:hypothetical protein